MHTIRRCRDDEKITILGVGSALISHLRGLSARRMLVGTWADAAWAIRFYQRESFALVPPPRARALLKSYWDIPERQVETSVVLEQSGNPPTAVSVT
jgi:hypothetical protein